MLGRSPGDCDGRPKSFCSFQITCPKQLFGRDLDVALRSLPHGNRPQCSLLLPHAVLFLGLHDGIPTATST